MKFKYPEGDEMAWETGEADLCMKGVSTLRLGAEYKPIPAFSLRAGYPHLLFCYILEDVFQNQELTQKLYKVLHLYKTTNQRVNLSI